MKAFWYGVLGISMIALGVGDAAWGEREYFGAAAGCDPAAPLPFSISWAVLSIGLFAGGVVALSAGVDAGNERR